MHKVQQGFVNIFMLMCRTLRVRSCVDERTVAVINFVFFQHFVVTTSCARGSERSYCVANTFCFDVDYEKCIALSIVQTWFRGRLHRSKRSLTAFSCDLARTMNFSVFDFVFYSHFAVALHVGHGILKCRLAKRRRFSF